MRVDSAKHAEAMGAIGTRMRGIGELEEAFRRATAADRTTVIHVEVQPHDWTEGNGAWWDCGTREVSDRPAVQEAYARHRAGKARRRVEV